MGPCSLPRVSSDDYNLRRNRCSPRSQSLLGKTRTRSSTSSPSQRSKGPSCRLEAITPCVRVHWGYRILVRYVNVRKASPRDVLLLMSNDRAFWYLQKKGFPFSNIVLSFGNYPIDTTALNESNTVYFFTLVVMQWG